jgi:hypothetical protein
VLDTVVGLLGCDTIVGLVNRNMLKECKVVLVFIEFGGLL